MYKTCMCSQVFSPFSAHFLPHDIIAEKGSTGSANLQVFDGTGREGLVVPAAVAAGAGNGLRGYRVTLTQGQHTLGGRESCDSHVIDM